VAISVREEAVKLVGGFVTKARQSFNAPSFLSFGAPYLLQPIRTRCSFWLLSLPSLAACHLSQGFDITEGYLDGLLVRLRDKGVSVRKTVVGILRDVLLYQVEYTRTRTHPSLLHWHIRSLIIYSLLYCSTRYTHPPVLNTPYYAAL